MPLTGLPGLTDNQSRSLADYLNILFRLSIGLGALAGVIKITMAGIKYMSSDAFSSKEEAKKDITGALLGLLIMLSTVVILQFIYPGILNLSVLQQLPPIKTAAPESATSQFGTGSQVSAEDQTAFTQTHPGKTVLNTLELREWAPGQNTFERYQADQDTIQRFRNWCQEKQGAVERKAIRGALTTPFFGSQGEQWFCLGNAQSTPAAAVSTPPDE